MIETIDITKEIYDSAHRLQKAGDSLFKLAEKKAEQERLYRRGLQIEILTLRTDKVQATLIIDIAKGLCSDLLFERDLADARYQSARDNVNAIQSQINALQSILRVQANI